MNPELRQKAIQQVLRQRNPFHDNPILKLQRRGWPRLWHHPRLRSSRLRLASLAFFVVEKFSKCIMIMITPIMGFVLATIIIVLPITVALYWLNFKLTAINLKLLTEQSWRNYSSWFLFSGTLFCFPYWWWGIPLALTLRYYHSLHRWYTRQRLRWQLQATHCDDPAYLSAQIAQHPQMTNHIRPSQWVARWLETSGKAVGAVTGTLAALVCLILCLKLTILMWQHGGFGQSMAIFLSCPAVIYLPLLVFRSYRSGEAVAAMVIDLLQGSRYKEATMSALGDFWVALFEDL